MARNRSQRHKSLECSRTRLDCGYIGNGLSLMIGPVMSGEVKVFKSPRAQDLINSYSLLSSVRYGPGSDREVNVVTGVRLEVNLFTQARNQ